MRPRNRLVPGGLNILDNPKAFWPAALNIITSHDQDHDNVAWRRCPLQDVFIDTSTDNAAQVRALVIPACRAGGPHLQYSQSHTWPDIL